jgi:hypothetical protein
MVRTGEPVFPRLTCFLNVGFTYTILGNQLTDISGSHQMVARVMDTQSGWQRTIPILPQTAFYGNSYLATANADLCQLVSLVNLVERKRAPYKYLYCRNHHRHCLDAVAAGQPVEVHLLPL